LVFSQCSFVFLGLNLKGKGKLFEMVNSHLNELALADFNALYEMNPQNGTGDLIHLNLQAFVSIVGSTTREKIQLLTTPMPCNNGQRSILQTVFCYYHVWLEIRHNDGRVIEIEDLKIEHYPEFQQEVTATFNVDFLTVGQASFRVNLKYLYIYENCHEYARQGVLRFEHIRYWPRIDFYLPYLQLQPTTVEDFWMLLNAANRLRDNEFDQEAWQIIAFNFFEW